MEVPKAIDFETQPIGFFDRQRKSLDWSGHPRFAKAELVSVKELAGEFVSREIPKLPMNQNQTVIFHNASFDIAVGANSEAWDESEFR